MGDDAEKAAPLNSIIETLYKPPLFFLVKVGPG